MFKIYVDAGYNWTKTDKNGKGKGEICVVIPEEVEVWREKLTIEVPGLKQLNNRFELIAINRALDILRKRKIEDFEILSDSKVAVNWANHPKVKWIRREDNIAGHILDS